MHRVKWTTLNRDDERIHSQGDLSCKKSTTHSSLWGLVPGRAPKMQQSAPSSPCYFIYRSSVGINKIDSGLNE